MRRLAALALSTALLAGCTTTEVLVPEATSAALVGSVLGVVTSRSTGLPVTGVAVSAPLAVGEATATTDADGRYLLAGLPAGATHTVRFSRAGFVQMAKAVPLVGAGGDVSQQNITATADLVMSEATAAVEGTVLAGQAPATGAVVSIDLRQAGFDLVVVATADGAGAYRLAGLPAAGGQGFTVTVSPLDRDADGRADYQPMGSWVALHGGLATHLDLALTPVAGASGSGVLSLVSDDLSAGQHAADAPVRLTYDRPLDASLTQVGMDDWTTNRTVAAQWETDALGTSLLVAPVGGAPLAQGHEYRLSATVFALDGTTASYYRTFRAADGGTPPAPVTGLLVEPAVANWDTRAFTLRWDATPEADRYEVWIRDSGANPNYTRLTTVGSQPWPAVTVTLPSDFDHYTGDTLQTPFLWGTAVDFAVVPLGAAGASSGLAAATPLRVRDVVTPSVTGTSQSGSAANEGGSPQEVELHLSFDEYMDPDAAPDVTLPLPGMTATFAMDPGLRAGTLTVTVPAGTDGTGPVAISGLADSSGNVLPSWTGSLRRRVELLSGGGFDAGTLAPWVASSSGTASPPAWTSNRPASGAGAVWLGAQGATPQGGYSRITQEVAVPAGATAVAVSLRYRSGTTASYGYDDLDCGLYTTGGSLILSVLDTSCANAPAYATASKTGLTGLAGTTVRLQCQVNQWSSYASYAVLDEISVVADL